MLANYGGKIRKLYHKFVDLEKTFDQACIKAIKWALRRQDVPERLIRIVLCLYEDSKTKMRAAVGTTEVFNIKVGVHKKPTLSPLLSVLFLEEVSNRFRMAMHARACTLPNLATSIAGSIIPQKCLRRNIGEHHSECSNNVESNSVSYV